MFFFQQQVLARFAHFIVFCYSRTASPVPGLINQTTANAHTIETLLVKVIEK